MSYPLQNQCIVFKSTSAQPPPSSFQSKYFNNSALRGTSMHPPKCQNELLAIPYFSNINPPFSSNTTIPKFGFHTLSVTSYFCAIEPPPQNTKRTDCHSNNILLSISLLSTYKVSDHFS